MPETYVGVAKAVTSPDPSATSQGQAAFLHKDPDGTSCYCVLDAERSTPTTPILRAL